MSYSRDQVEDKIKELVARLDAGDNGARALADSLPDPRVLALHVSDLDADYWTELAQGRIGPLRAERRKEYDILITATSEDLVELIDGRASLFSAYVAGRVRIDASFGDLLRLRKLAS
jgi:predicted lipid carrier protein YhbT